MHFTLDGYMKAMIISGFVTSALLASAGARAVPVELSFDPDSAQVEIGFVISIDLLADIPEPVLGWGIDLSFDTSILSLVGVTIGDRWLSAPGFDGDGLVGLALPAVSGDGIVLATLDFEGESAGSSAISASVTAGDPTEGLPLLSGGFAEVVFNSATLDSVVPEPPTLALMLGLIGIVQVRFLWVLARASRRPRKYSVA